MDTLNFAVEPLRAFLVQVGSYLPRLGVALAVLVAGWLFAKAVRFAAVKALRALNFHVLTERAGVDAFLQQGGTERDTVDLFGLIAYWLVILVALIVAFNGLGLTQVTELLGRVLMFVPKLLVGLLVLVFGLYYRRYRDKELVTAAALFNIFIFAVLTVLSKVEFGLAAGFGLFAILAMFTLRSEPIGKTEITYFFGSVAIAVICSVQGTTLPFVASIAALVVLGAWAVDHPRVLQSVDGIRITLDKIEMHALSDPIAMRADLSKRLGVDVMSYQITALDYINDGQVAVVEVLPQILPAEDAEIVARLRPDGDARSSPVRTCARLWQVGTRGSWQVRGAR